jgi:hypothetical protein
MWGWQQLICVHECSILQNLLDVLGVNTALIILGPATVSGENALQDLYYRIKASGWRIFTFYNYSRLCRTGLCSSDFVSVLNLRSTEPTSPCGDVSAGLATLSLSSVEPRPVALCV